LLKDLSAFSEEEVGLAVLGDPIAHSISPQLHNAALKDLSRVDSAYDKWRYDKIEVSPAQLEVALLCDDLLHSSGECDPFFLFAVPVGPPEVIIGLKDWHLIAGKRRESAKCGHYRLL
jgi:hypothetical protein